MSYNAPVKDMMFVLKELAGLDQVSQLPGCEDATEETVDAVLNENAKFTSEVVAPLNWSGDVEAANWKDGVVTTAKGFKEAFKAFGEQGWQGLQHPTEFGGQGLPKLVATPCMEMVNGSNLSFALCPLLTDGAIEALLVAGSQQLKETYIPKMISGEWTGTMNLTEPQAGSDLALVRSKAVPQGDGTYRISGQKIYITYGEHDMAKNIVHLVLARTPDAPEGVKGISLFVVPKFMVNDDGSLGKRNDVYCASIEHKLGIKASPTAVLLYGDNKGEVGQGAIGYLVGEENKGLQYMFVMMNAARFQVGVQGIGLAERAYQKAVQYANDRVQSRPVDGSSNEAVAIIHHPDVKRMLMSMRSQVEAARAMACVAGAAYDAAHYHPDEATRKQNMAVYEFMVPLVKGWSTEMSIDVTSTGVQVHGGMGFIEETGAAQYYRDAKILTIYEGTTAIQANDLVGRKTSRDGGAMVKTLCAEIARTVVQLNESGSAHAKAVAARLDAARASFLDAAQFVVDNMKSNPNAVFAGSVPYLKLAGTTVAGWQMARALLAAEAKIKAGETDSFYSDKILTSRFFADHVLNTVPGLRDSIVNGYQGVTEMAVANF
ncbi:MAG: acyl-CoA dehydrogenase [Limnobacter sp.]|jgi:alkylation response protein AidB-like acyl-CoA dehydrogenase|uniref:acyl-CoA dehydrogenase n=1 Tax=Limnobacter sp. TaxID=2003368 RepID=UPI00122590F7|nr:acyl-CoA dehydrogenase [Limnobacter sp.]MBA4315890.1 acyl-CoA dehydrogenase [Alcaligenaceae bacterium]RZO92362.1 MAG: acyl-CoA dehydrogenase [Limnobacter sp.]